MIDLGPCSLRHPRAPIRFPSLNTVVCLLACPLGCLVGHLTRVWQLAALVNRCSSPPFPSNASNAHSGSTSTQCAPEASPLPIEQCLRALRPYRSVSRLSNESIARAQMGAGLMGLSAETTPHRTGVPAVSPCIWVLGPQNARFPVHSSPPAFPPCNRANLVFAPSNDSNRPAAPLPQR